ncbi:NnrU family protein, partial [Vibrio parahaemolyticus]
MAAAAWILLHLLIAGTFRPAIADRIGEPAFRGLFSVLSAASLGFLVWA